MVKTVKKLENLRKMLGVLIPPHEDSCCGCGYCQSIDLLDKIIKETEILEDKAWKYDDLCN